MYRELINELFGGGNAVKPILRLPKNLSNPSLPAPFNPDPNAGYNFDPNYRVKNDPVVDAPPPQPIAIEPLAPSSAITPIQPLSMDEFAFRRRNHAFEGAPRTEPLGANEYVRTGREPDILRIGDGTQIAPPVPDNVATVPASRSLTPAQTTAAEMNDSVPVDLNAALRLPSQDTQEQINAIQNKDYSIKTDPNTGEKIRGKDRDRDWSWKEKLGSSLLGALEGFANTGNIFGAAAGGISAGTNRNFFEQRKDQENLFRLGKTLEQQQKSEKFYSDQENARVQRANILDDNERARREFDERMLYYRDEQSRKIGDRKSREQTARMNQVAGLFKNLPAYDPSDPKFAELTKALGDVNLPITPKDAKKNVKLIQDQRSGAWSVVLTDPISGGQETRDVKSADGKGVLTTTPQVVMAGELGLTKQNDQQEFTATENEKNRQQQIKLKQISADLDRQMVDYKSKLEAAQKETDFNRRKQLQDQAEASRLEGIRLTKQLEQENIIFRKSVK